MECLFAPMSGKVLKVECKVGERVCEHDPIIILEAMKMETELFAPVAGIVREIRVGEGDTVQEEQALAMIEIG